MSTSSETPSSQTLSTQSIHSVHIKEEPVETEIKEKVKARQKAIKEDVKIKSEPNSPVRQCHNHDDGYDTERISSPPKSSRRRVALMEQDTERIDPSSNDPPPAANSSEPKDEVESKLITLLGVFNNSSIRSNITIYLSFEEMKSLRLVSKKINSFISSFSHYLNRTRLRICSKLLRKTKYEMQKESFDKLNKIPWRNIEVKLDMFNLKMDFLIFRSLNPIFFNILDLKIGISKCVKTELDIDKIKMINMLEFLVQFPNLKSLSIDFIFTSAFQTMNSSSADLKAKLGNILSQLREFKTEGHDVIDLLNHENSELLSSITNLRSFAIPQKAICTKEIANQTRKAQIFKCGLYKLALQSAKSITKLDLNFDGLGDFDSVKCIFPALRELKIRETKLKPNGETFTMKFLRLQPLNQLKILALEIFSKSGGSLRALIDVIIKKNCENLEELHLKAVKINKVENWGFLLHLPLRCFRIFVPKMNNGQLENNPGNAFIIEQFDYEKIRELNFRGLNLFDFSSLLSHGDKLVNLVHLSLLECRAVLDDEKLEFISKNLTKLQVLEFSHCDNVTDFGITGLDADEDNPDYSNFSLKNIKGLKTLRMLACKNITDRSCQFGILFAHLRILDLTNDWKITNAGVKHLVENNKSLSQLFLSSRMKNTIDEKIKWIGKERGINFNFELIQTLLRDPDDDAKIYNVESELVTLSDSGEE